MKRSAKGLGAILGVSLGAKSLFDFGKSALTASENLKSAAGVKFDKLNKDFEITKNSLNDIRDGLGSLITDKTFAVLGKGFIDTFGRSNEMLNRFQFLLKQSAIEAGRTGKSVEDVFIGLQRAVTVGEFGGLEGFGLLTKGDIQEISDIQAGIEAGEIGGRIGRAQKFNKLIDVLSSVQQEQINRVKATSDEFFILQETARKATQNIDSLSEAVLIKGAGALNTIFDMAKSLKKDFERIKEGGEIVQEKDKLFFLKDKNTQTKTKSLTEEKAIINNEFNTTINVQSPVNEKEVVEIYKKNAKKDIEDASFQVQGSGEQR